MTEPLELNARPPTGAVDQLADHLFRQESGKLVSVLTGLFGVERLHMAEDVVQESLARALKTWPFYGIPKNPTAWITQTAKRLAIDLIRRETVFRDKQPQIIAYLERWPATATDDAPPQFEEEIRDDTLRLMFTCCHPQIPQDARAPLAMKTLCGFSSGEIASAFLSSEAAIAKRLTRARERIREARIPFEIPHGEDLANRLDGVLRTLYLLFNEGYKASSGETLIREDVCAEAIRLTKLLSEHPVGNRPATHALLALMLFNAARLRSRLDSDGNILRLKQQDRSNWDRGTIARAISHLTRAAVGTDLTEYHLEAAIAACHCTAKDYATTNWPRILGLYDHLLQLNPSPVIALNRAVALAQVEGPRAGIDAIDSIPNKRSLESYYLLYAVLAEFHFKLHELERAAANLQKALGLTEAKSERRLLADRLAECTALA